MTRYTLAPLARADLDSIWDHIAIERQSPAGARSQVDRIYQRLAMLAENPLLGQRRDDLREGLRAFTVDSYVLFYYVAEGGIDVAGIVHGARDIETIFRNVER